ncbi:TPA: hypothetical protein ACF5B0_004590 [Vibrio parahaemolyticus]|uniref:hypothetical protein n=1 Tax=Vibrio diabolicus TaxID=50719 RepID=UPI0036AA843D|nr:hypothetical protein [Vibrio parahaemolyticus]
MKIVKGTLQAIALVVVLVFAAKVALKSWNANEESTSSLLVNTCGIIPYNDGEFDCKKYKELVKELKSAKVEGITNDDILCLSTSALSAELPVGTPSAISDMVSKKVLKVEKLPDCDTVKALDKINKALKRTLELKKIEESAVN